MSSLSYDVLRVYIKNVFNIISRFFKVHIYQISINSADLQGQSNVLKKTEGDL